MEQQELETILGREENTEFIEYVSNTFPEYFRGKKILVTGGNGSLGNALADWFDAHSISSYYLLDVETDNEIKGRRIHHCDIMTYNDIRDWTKNTKANYVFHFAAAKHAPVGEVEPLETMFLNVQGTQNIIEAIEDFGADGCRLILSSTCKSIMPETCYGASKLIADRLTLNAGHSVVRYYNVVQSSGNVFEIWSNTNKPVVTPCTRYFISLDEAICLTLYGALAEPGRYSIGPGEPRFMLAVAEDLEMKYTVVDPRRGDRVVEPLIGPNEEITDYYGPIFKVVNYNDFDAA